MDKEDSEVVLAWNKVVSEAALAEDKEVNSYEYKPSSEIMGEITEEQKRERLRRVENKSKKLLSSNDTYKQHVSGRSSTISKEKKKNIDYVQIIKDNKSNLTRQYERDSAIDKYSSVYTSFIDAEMDSAIHKNKKKRRKTTLDNKVKESTVESDLNEGFIKLSNKFNKEIEEIKRYQIKSIGLSFIFKEHVRLNPFEESGGAVWVKISLKELALLPINISGYITNPFIIASFKKYRHLLLGAKYEEEKQMYMLGVPRTYKEQDFNKASHIGFTYFKCCREQEPVQGSYGYWINYMRI